MIRFKISIFAFFILAIISLGCKKNNENIINGTLREMLSNKAVANAEVVLEANEIKSGSINTNYTVLQTTTTDDQGQFNFNFEPKSVLSYKITFNKDGYISTVHEFFPDDFSGIYEIDEIIPVLSNLNLTVKNIWPYTDNDLLKVRISSTNLNHCLSCCHDNIRFFNGMGINETVSCKLIGGDSISIMTIVERTYGTSVNEVKLFAPPNETLSYSIEY
jgi:hypothetical protein